MKNQLLLLEDVDNYGRSGDLVSVKPGFARNYLLPQKKAVIADKRTIRMQEKLKAERNAKAAKDRKESEELAKQLTGKVVSIKVKIDTEGRMYGSVTALEIVKHVDEQLKLKIEKKGVILPKPIKRLGSHEVDLRLAEGVPAKVALEVLPEGEQTAAAEE